MTDDMPQGHQVYINKVMDLHELHSMCRCDLCFNSLSHVSNGETIGRKLDLKEVGWNVGSGNLGAVWPLSNSHPISSSERRQRINFARR